MMTSLARLLVASLLALAVAVPVTGSSAVLIIGTAAVPHAGLPQDVAGALLLPLIMVPIFYKLSADFPASLLLAFILIGMAAFLLRSHFVEYGRDSWIFAGGITGLLVGSAMRIEDGVFANEFPFLLLSPMIGCSVAMLVCRWWLWRDGSSAVTP